jgi:hypothetical protein
MVMRLLGRTRKDNSVASERKYKTIHQNISAFHDALDRSSVLHP